MNYNNWRNSEKVRALVKGVAERLGGNLDAMVAESIIENLLLAAWIDGASQGAAAESCRRDEEVRERAEWDMVSDEWSE